MVTPAHCRNYFKKSPFFLPRAAPEHLPRRILGIFLLGRRLVFHSAPKKIPFSSQNLVAEPRRGGMQPAAQIYGGGHGRGCQKKKFVQKFFSFWNQQFLKKEMGVNLRCFGAAECWAQIRQSANRQSADLPVRTPASPQLLFMSGAFGEPPFLYAVALFKDFQDAPE